MNGGILILDTLSYFGERFPISRTVAGKSFGQFLNDIIQVV